ncbi:CS1-pili formation C-terminal domain-containing protein [Vibrio maritimus]|uniref:CS1-pili formation C-terminal domain-containing protein n=1 Tax=Vibrio maritimus TaxID=990268 RepID=UPI0040675881
MSQNSIHALILLLLFFSNSVFSENISEFYEKLYADPIVVRINVNERQDNVLGLVKFDGNNQIKLIQVYEGQLDGEIEATLSKGVDLSACRDGCDGLDLIDFDTTTSSLMISYVPKKTNRRLDFSSKNNSLIFRHHTSFSNSVGTIRLSGSLLNQGRRYEVDSDLGYNSTADSKGVNARLRKLSTKNYLEDRTLDFGLLDSIESLKNNRSFISSSATTVLGLGINNNVEKLYHYNNTSLNNDIVINLVDNSNVSISFNGRVIKTLRLQSGIQRIPVDDLPSGNYPVELVIQPDTMAEYKQTEYVFNSSRRQLDKQYGLVTGISLDEKLTYKTPYLSAFYNANKFKFLDVSVSGLVTLDDLVGKVSAEVPIDKFILNSELEISDSNEQNIINRLAYTNSNFSANLSHNVTINSRDHDYGLSFSSFYQLSSTSTFGLSYSNRGNSLNPESYTAGLDFKKRFVGSEYRPQVSFGMTHNASKNGVNEQRFFANISFNFSSGRDYINFRTSTRKSGELQYVDNNLSYVRSFNDSFIDTVNADAEFSESSHQLGLGTSFSSNSLRGDLYYSRASNNTRESSFIGNVNGVVYSNFNEVAFDKEYAEQGVIVSISGNDDGVVNSYLEGEVFEITKGNRFIPLEPFKDNKIYFDHVNGYEVSSNFDTFRVKPNEIKHYNLSVVDTITVIGRLVNERQKPLPNRKVKNHASETITGDGGVFVLNVDKRYPFLKIDDEEVEISVTETNIAYVGDIVAGD